MTTKSLNICHKQLVTIYCISCVINIAYIGNIKDKMSYGKYSVNLDNYIEIRITIYIIIDEKSSI